MKDLAAACSNVLETQSTDQFLEFFGQCFVQYFSHYGYDRIVQVSGRHYRDFLRGIDNLHETMRFSFPKMSTPSFYVTDEHDNGCYLHYRSHRKGYTYYVIGQLKQCALKFYNTIVNIEVLQENEHNTNMHVIYNLQFDNKAFVPKNSAIRYQVAKTVFDNIQQYLFHGKSFVAFLSHNASRKAYQFPYSSISPLCQKTFTLKYKLKCVQQMQL